MPPAIFQSNEIVSNATYIHIVFLDHLGYKPVTSSFYSILFNFFLVLFVCVLFSYVFCLCYLIMFLVCVFFLWSLFLCSLFVFLCCLFVFCACITKRIQTIVINCTFTVSMFTFFFTCISSPRKQCGLVILPYWIRNTSYLNQPSLCILMSTGNLCVIILVLPSIRDCSSDFSLGVLLFLHIS